uniref:Putative ovule protein n=1 Tax=Solanum chacoense TaxID=4108 RepID=A0A0V0GWF5_SOLCH
MLLGFISLLLTVLQERILKICIPKHLTNHWLPCKKDDDVNETVHFQTNFFSLIPGGRRLLAESANSGYCEAKVCLNKRQSGGLKLLLFTC